MADGWTSPAARGAPTVSRANVGDYTITADESLRDGMVFMHAHQALLSEFNAELDAEMQEAMHEGGKVTRTYLRGNSPKATGAYSRSWGCDFSDSDGHHVATVTNRRFWTLTHVLEDGHVAKNQYGGPYGRVKPAKPEHHLARATEVGKRVIEKKLGVKL